jgi:hypothetical protein
MEMVAEYAVPSQGTQALNDSRALEIENVSEGLHIDLWLRDSDVVSAIEAHPEGRRRDDYTRTAVRIGVLALQQAQGRVDAEALNSAGDRLITQLEGRLGNYQAQLSTVLTGALKDYFDPTNGRFHERVERLVKKDGDLERAIRGEMDAALLSMKQSLYDQLGPGSTFAQMISPTASNALLSAIRESVDALVRAQRDAVLAEFTLDNREGALSRLLDELTAKNGRFTGDLRESVETVIGEFSLDKEDSALSRLVKRVEAAQRQISAEFTLDSEESALSRMKRDLQGTIEALRKESAEFQQTVIAALEAMKARRQESLASTRHGKEFELAGFAFVEEACQKAGDIPEHVGDRAGDIKHCKVGDCVITLGPDCDAAGARIVCEFKEDASYDLRRSLGDLETARANRKAEVGLFVHSKRTAPVGLKPLARYGNDVVVVWDAEDEVTDTYLGAAIMVCKALAVRKSAADAELAADLDALDKCIREVERQAGYLDEIKTSSSTIRSGAEKILDRVEKMRSALGKQVETLDAQAGVFRRVLGATPAGD